MVWPKEQGEHSSPRGPTERALTFDSDPVARSDRWSSLARSLPEASDVSSASTTSGVLPEQERQPSATEIWSRRTWTLLKVLACVYLGVTVAVLPWTPWWANNNLLLNYPTLRGIVLQPFFRGAVSGVGLLDLWIAIAEVLNYRDPRPK